MPWVSMSQTDSNHMALMTANEAAKPTPKIQVKYHIVVPPSLSKVCVSRVALASPSRCPT